MTALFHPPAHAREPAFHPRRRAPQCARAVWHSLAPEFQSPLLWLAQDRIAAKAHAADSISAPPPATAHAPNRAQRAPTIAAGRAPLLASARCARSLLPPRKARWLAPSPLRETYLNASGR